MSLNAQWMQRDLAVLWHPCTQMKDHERLPVIPIKRGDGVWLEDFDGKRYLDAVSSWWVNVFGHGNPRIEGLPAADWVLVDAGDVVVHLFRPEVRSFYNLERMWGFGEDAPAAGTA